MAQRNEPCCAFLEVVQICCYCSWIESFVNMQTGFCYSPYILFEWTTLTGTQKIQIPER